MWFPDRRIQRDLRHAGFADSEVRAVRESPPMWAQLTAFYRGDGRIERVEAAFSGARSFTRLPKSFQKFLALMPRSGKTWLLTKSYNTVATCNCPTTVRSVMIKPFHSTSKTAIHIATSAWRNAKSLLYSFIASNTYRDTSRFAQHRNMAYRFGFSLGQ